MYEKEMKRLIAMAMLASNKFNQLSEAISALDFKQINELSKDIRLLREMIKTEYGLEV